MAMTARFIKNVTGFTGDARLYLTSDQGYVVVSATAAYTAPETYIFPSDETGDVTSWGELEGSYRGGLDHSVALEGAGYEVI